MAVTNASIPNKNSWQDDDEKVELYFHACHENYKGWFGDAPERLKLKLYAVYKQATVGDCNEPRPFDSVKRKKWEMWKVFGGTETIVAMRRYITLLVQLDPVLVVVEVQEKPPPMFPTTPMGEPICARANCKAGCISPLISRGSRKVWVCVWGGFFC
jgi:acyl-CoA-binding protein